MLSYMSKVTVQNQAPNVQFVAQIRLSVEK